MCMHHWPISPAVLDSASDAVAFSKRSRTQVYSGKKTSSGPQGACIRVLVLGMRTAGTIIDTMLGACM